MIPTYIETARDVPRGERVIALDAGGTNMRVAGVSFDEAGAPVIDGLARHRMPGVDAALSRDEFFRCLGGCRAASPPGQRQDRVLLFLPGRDHPAEGRAPDPVHEGDQGEGRGGRAGGAGLLDALSASRATAGAGAASAAGEDARVILLNDTVATLLAGRNAVPGRRFDDFIGLVCGTGLNAAYVERNSLITKVAGHRPGRARRWSTRSPARSPGARVGPVDDAFDATMANPGRYRHEKTISGAYLGALCLFAAQSAARAGLPFPGRGPGARARGSAFHPRAQRLPPLPRQRTAIPSGQRAPVSRRTTRAGCMSSATRSWSAPRPLWRSTSRRSS